MRDWNFWRPRLKKLTIQRLHYNNFLKSRFYIWYFWKYANPKKDFFAAHSISHWWWSKYYGSFNSSRMVKFDQWVAFVTQLTRKIWNRRISDFKPSTKRVFIFPFKDTVDSKIIRAFAIILEIFLWFGCQFLSPSCFLETA